MNGIPFPELGHSLSNNNKNGSTSYQAVSFGENPEAEVFDEVMKQKMKQSVIKEIDSPIMNLKNEIPPDLNGLGGHFDNFLNAQKSTGGGGEAPSSFQTVQFGPMPSKQFLAGNLEADVKVPSFTAFEFDDVEKQVPRAEVLDQFKPVIPKPAPRPQPVKQEPIRQQVLRDDQNRPKKSAQASQEFVARPGAAAATMTKHQNEVAMMKPSKFEQISPDDFLELNRPKKSSFISSNFESAPKAKPFEYVRTIVNVDNPTSYQKFVMGENADTFFDMEFNRRPKKSFYSTSFDARPMFDYGNDNDAPSYAYQVTGYRQPLKSVEGKKMKKEIPFRETVPINQHQQIPSPVLHTDEPTSYQFVSFGPDSTLNEFQGNFEEIQAPILGSQLHHQEEDVGDAFEEHKLRKGTTFKDDFRKVVEIKVRQHRLHDKRSLQNPAFDSGFPISGNEDGFSPMTDGHLFGQNFPEIHHHFKDLGSPGQQQQQQPIHQTMVVVDPLEGFRKPLPPVHHGLPETVGDVVVGTPLQVAEEQPPIPEPLGPPSIHKTPAHFQHKIRGHKQQQPHAIQFEVEDARLKNPRLPHGPVGLHRPNPGPNPPFNPTVATMHSDLLPPLPTPVDLPELEYPDLEEQVPIGPPKNQVRMMKAEK